MSSFVPSMQSALAEATGKIEAEQAARTAGTVDGGGLEDVFVVLVILCFRIFLAL